MIQRSEWLDFYGNLFDDIIVKSLAQLDKSAQNTELEEE